MLIAQQDWRLLGYCHERYRYLAVFLSDIRRCRRYRNNGTVPSSAHAIAYIALGASLTIGLFVDDTRFFQVSQRSASFFCFFSSDYLPTHKQKYVGRVPVNSPRHYHGIFQPALASCSSLGHTVIEALIVGIADVFEHDSWHKTVANHGASPPSYR